MDALLINNFTVNETEMLTGAMQKIDDNANGLVFVINDKNELVGVVSDGDIRRWILKGGEINTRIDALMNRNPIYVETDYRVEIESYFAEKKVKAIPVLDRKQHIIDILLAEDVRTENKNESMTLHNVTVVVMAGGRGTRLYPYTKILPKPLIPIGEIPIVERVINSFNEYGITDFIMTVNYKKNMIETYFTDIENDYTINFVEEDQPLGTAGSIRLINRIFKNPIFVANCDSLVRTDYVKLYQHHTDTKNAITIVIALKNDTIPYGVVYSKENGILERIDEKPTRSYFINTGMYIINPEIIELIPPCTFFHMTHLVDHAIEKGYRVGVYPVSEDSFLDMGEFAEMRRMEEKLNVHIREIK